MAHTDLDKQDLPPLPAEPIRRVLDPLAHFLHIEAAGGIVLLLATAAALGLANSPLAEDFGKLWKTSIGLTIGGFELMGSLKHWINDGLMTVFFFVIGLEVKREIVLGELADVRRATLPIVAALGGMLVPAGVYLALQSGQPGEAGWGIPMATDIAFVVGCMALLGPRIPRGLRIMLLSLAIVDDIGAILVIAIGYTENIDLTSLALGFTGIALCMLLRFTGVRSIGVYSLVGVLVWLAFHESGVHATIAGVILGLITPTKGWIDEGLLRRTVSAADDALEHRTLETSRYGTLRTIETVSRESLSPLERIETRLHPWVGFAIMPLFALANAGVPVSLDAIGEPVSLAVMAGLLIGKPVGIVGFSWLATRLGVASLPKGVGWGAVLGGGLLAGIGFTMALFIAGLALSPEVLDTAKVGVLIASGIAAVVGMAVLMKALPKVGVDDDRSPGRAPRRET